MITRADMNHALMLDGRAPTKTFIVEAHTDDPQDFLGHMAGKPNVEPTRDTHLFRVHVPEGVIWVDQLDSRFWSFHTDISMQPANAFLRKEIERHRELDWVWLPSDHLRHMWPRSISRQVKTTFNGKGFVGSSAAATDLRVQLSGHDADYLLEYISKEPRYRSSVSFQSVQETLTDPDLGYLEEAVSRMGKFVVSGDSFEFHSQFVRTVLQRYKALVTLCESKAISYDSVGPSDSGFTINGHPIVVRFKREIEDLPSFMGQLLSSRAPFRLWGSPEIDEDYARVDAVDLHVGSTMKIDVGTDWMRIYLSKGSCGNTVARMVANLQHTFDSALYFEDSELQAALLGQRAALGSRGN